MGKGVFNPFAAPKEDFVSPIGNDPLNTELEEVVIPSVRLDGDSFVLEFQDAELENVPDRLGALISELMSHPDARKDLVRDGVDMYPRGSTRKVDDGEMVLPTPHGYLSVFVGDERTEVTVFRVSHMLFTNYQ